VLGVSCNPNTLRKTAGVMFADRAGAGILRWMGGMISKHSSTLGRHGRRFSRNSSMVLRTRIYGQA
jgi:hypothetical protein